MSHTPGPWEDNWGSGVTGPTAAPMIYLPNHTFKLPIRAGMNPIVWLLKSTPFTAEDIANGKLIAAAPDLLEAMKYARRFLDTTLRYDADFIAAAINKAEGG